MLGGADIAGALAALFAISAGWFDSGGATAMDGVEFVGVVLAVASAFVVLAI